MPLPARPEYEALIYGLPGRYPAIIASTLHLFSVSATIAIVQGEIRFANSLQLRVTEVVDFHAGRIREYSYTILLALSVFADTTRSHTPKTQRCSQLSHTTIMKSQT